MSKQEAARARRARHPVHSYILRVVERRTTRIDVVYELHPIGTGARRRFASLAALQRYLAQAAARNG